MDEATLYGRLEAANMGGEAVGDSQFLHRFGDPPPPDFAH